jgi:hypothetical protein
MRPCQTRLRCVRMREPRPAGRARARARARASRGSGVLGLRCAACARRSDDRPGCRSSGHAGRLASRRAGRGGRGRERQQGKLGDRPRAPRLVDAHLLLPLERRCAWRAGALVRVRARRLTYTSYPDGLPVPRGRAGVTTELAAMKTTQLGRGVQEPHCADRRQGSTLPYPIPRRARASELAQPDLLAAGDDGVGEVVEAEAAGHVERKVAHHQRQERQQRLPKHAARRLGRGCSAMAPAH